MLEVRVIDVGVYPKQPLEDDFNDSQKVFGKDCFLGHWEYSFVVKLVLDPGHQEVNVLTCTHL